MLFGYPIEATSECWFHDCMMDMLRTTNEAILNNQKVPIWPAIIPDAYRTELGKKHGLKRRLKAYQDAASGLSHIELANLTNAINQQNDIAHLLAGDCDCSTVDDIPESVRKAIEDLFEFSFELLADLGIRDRQYQIIYNAYPFHICPFCGYEDFSNPASPREPLDHYLARSRYPFAAINPRNLVPMGDNCNSKYKLAKDILFAEDGSRRKAANPYNWTKIELSLINSKPFEGNHAIFPFPLWQIEFKPNSDELATWDSVFDIKQRYQRDVLDADFMSMLREFSNYCRDHKVKISSPHIIDALKSFSEYWKESGMKDKAFIKAAVFDMLHHHCEQGNERLLEIISGVVIGGMSLNA